jgi:hypothetical protein
MKETAKYYATHPEAKKKKAEYDKEYGKKTVKDRVSRNAARRAMVKAGKAKRGDGKDVDHSNGNPKDNRRSNLSVMSRSANRAKK